MEHPAALLPNRSPELRDVFHHDCGRLALLLDGFRPRYTDDFGVVSSWMDLIAWLDPALAEGTRIALDLETDKDGQVDMIGLACSAESARLIYLPDPELLTGLLERLRGHQVIVHYGEGLELPWLLSIYGDDDIPFVVDDLHKLFHAYDPEYAYAGRDSDDERGAGSGALAFIQSLYSWRPYHKHLLAVAVETHDRALKAVYCQLDCVVTWECFHRLRNKLIGEMPEALKAYERHAVPLLPIMAGMKKAGWKVDEELFAARRKELREQTQTQAQALVAEYGEGIKPKGKKAKTLVSMQGLKTVLEAQGVKLPKEKRANGTTSASLNREARQKLFLRHPELTGIEAYFGTQDRLSDFYKNGIIAEDGRCHATWSGYEKSWRWRCTDPNLTQWPEEDRDVFVADPGMVLVQFDTSAGEYRWFAGESGDPGLLAVFREYDRTGDKRTHPHVVNTALLFGVSPDEAVTWKVNPEPKLKARYVFSKNYIYRLLYSYDGGVDELRAAAAKSGLKFSRKDIEGFDRMWFDRYPVAKAYRERQAARAYRERFVSVREWGYGRRIHVQDDSKIKNIGLNHVEQAGIAGIVNETVCATWNEWRVWPLANMHDGLVYQWWADKNRPDEGDYESLPGFIEFIRASLTRPLSSINNMVIPVDVKVGPRWGTSMEDWKL